MERPEEDQEAHQSAQPGVLSILRRAIAVSACLFLGACSGPSAESKRAVNRFLAEGNYAEAQSALEKAKDKEYGYKNAVLYDLDLGMVLHNAGKYRESDEYFDRAEARMSELYTKSATKASATLLLNDNTVDYGGEAFERALTNVFRAMNYTFLGKPDEALVESRKVESYLDELSSHRSAKSRTYKDDAYARYLDSLLYADAGKTDDARISHEAAMQAYSWYASAYNTFPPPFAPLRDGDNEGEVVFIHYNGVAPRKISKSFQVAWGQGLAALNSAKEEGDAQASDPRVMNAVRAGVFDKSVTVAFPDYVQDPYSIVISEIRVDQKQSATALMEDISAIAIKDLRDRMALIKTRAVARAMVKFILAKAATNEAEKKYGKNSWQAILTKVGSNVAAAATEIADTRGWATLPSQIRMARLRLAPGTYDVQAVFKDGAGNVVSTHDFKDVTVKKGKRTYLQYRTAL